MSSTAETRATLAAAQASQAHARPVWPDASPIAAGGPRPFVARPGAEDRLAADLLRRSAAACDGSEQESASVDAASVLWTRFLKFDGADAGWPDRDRFVLSPGYGAGLHRALLRLTGVPDGQPEAPRGHGFADAVGMALAERFLAARFGRTLVDHRTWALASAGDLMQGVSHEAASLAGHLKLERLTVLWDDAAGQDADAASSEDTLRRFAAYGWATKSVERHDHAALAAAFGMAMRSRKPTLIASRAAAPAAPARSGLALDDASTAARWRAAGQRGSAARRGWLKRLAHHARRAEFERVTAGVLPEALAASLRDVKSGFAAARAGMATGAASEAVLVAVQAVLPELVGGAADPASPAARPARPQPGGFASRFLHFGAREHGMAAAMNGMAAHGGVLPYGGTVSALSESMRPALRLAALMKNRVVHVLTHESRAVEHLASLRAVPNLHVLRPADAIETAECWELALRRDDGPSLLVLGRDEQPSLRAEAVCNRCAEGGYVLAEADGERRATLIATGSEVAVALAARARLAAERIAVAVVSLPCWDLFARAGAAHHARVLGEALRFGIEAGSGFGWERWLGPDGVFIGCEDFAAAADLTPEAIAATVRRCLAA